MIINLQKHAGTSIASEGDVLPAATFVASHPTDTLRQARNVHPGTLLT